MPPLFVEAALADYQRDVAAFQEDIDFWESMQRRRNWVETTGDGHLPEMIRSVANHLMRKGFTESHAIAVAVNVVKKMCATGDLNFPGRQVANPASRARACRSVASWEAKKAQARARRG